MNKESLLIIVDTCFFSTLCFEDFFCASTTWRRSGLESLIYLRLDSKYLYTASIYNKIITATP